MAAVDLPEEMVRAVEKAKDNTEFLEAVRGYLFYPIEGGTPAPPHSVQEWSAEWADTKRRRMRDNYRTSDLSDLLRKYYNKHKHQRTAARPNLIRATVLQSLFKATWPGFPTMYKMHWLNRLVFGPAADGVATKATSSAWEQVQDHILHGDVSSYRITNDTSQSIPSMHQQDVIQAEKRSQEERAQGMDRVYAAHQTQTRKRGQGRAAGVGHYTAHQEAAVEEEAVEEAQRETGTAVEEMFSARPVDVEAAIAQQQPGILERAANAASAVARAATAANAIVATIVSVAAPSPPNNDAQPQAQQHTLATEQARPVTERAAAATAALPSASAHPSVSWSPPAPSVAAVLPPDALKSFFDALRKARVGILPALGEDSHAAFYEKFYTMLSTTCNLMVAAHQGQALTADQQAYVTNVQRLVQMYVRSEKELYRGALNMQQPWYLKWMDMMHHYLGFMERWQSPDDVLASLPSAQPQASQAQLQPAVSPAATSIYPSLDAAQSSPPPQPIIPPSPKTPTPAFIAHYVMLVYATV